MNRNRDLYIIILTTIVYLMLSVLYLYWPSCLNPAYRPVEKAIPIILLACLLAWKCGRQVILPVCALLFSAAGDYTGDSGAAGFLPSIALFGIAQILYAVTFARRFRWQKPRLPVAVLYLVGISILITHLAGSPKLADPILKCMVFTYTTVISAMALTALFYDKCNLILPVGALIFTLSDSLIAWDRFISPVPNAGIWVMATYGLAQYFIALGILLSCASIPKLHKS